MQVQGGREGGRLLSRPLASTLSAAAEERTTNASRPSDVRWMARTAAECATPLFMRAGAWQRTLSSTRPTTTVAQSVGAAARAFLLKLSAPEIPRRSLAHGRAESKKAIGPRGKKEGREGGREEEAKEEAEAGAEELRFRPHHHHRTRPHGRRRR